MAGVTEAIQSGQAVLSVLLTVAGMTASTAWLVLKLVVNPLKAKIIELEIRVEKNEKRHEETTKEIIFAIDRLRLDLHQFQLELTKKLSVMVSRSECHDMQDRCIHKTSTFKRDEIHHKEGF